MEALANVTSRSIFSMDARQTAVGFRQVAFVARQRGDNTAQRDDPPNSLLTGIVYFRAPQGSRSKMRKLSASRSPRSSADSHLQEPRKLIPPNVMGGPRRLRTLQEQLARQLGWVRGPVGFTIAVWLAFVWLVGSSFAEPTPSVTPLGAAPGTGLTSSGGDLLVPGLLAFVVGASITGVELLTSKYPNTTSFAVKSSSLWLYVIIYGALAALVTTFAARLGVSFHQGSPYLRAIEAGIGVKAFLHINLFSVSTSPTTTFPVGVESLVQIFEPKLLRNILLDEYTLVISYLNPKVRTYPNPPNVKATISASVPGALSLAERTAFLTDLDGIIPNVLPAGYNNSAGIARAMELYLRLVGKSLVDQVFP